MKNFAVLLLPLTLALYGCSGTSGPTKKVVNCEVRGLTFTPNPVVVEKNLTVQLSAAAKIGPTGCVGSPTVGAISGWTTSDAGKVVVDSQGVVRGVTETGSGAFGYVSAKIGAKTGKVKITVLPATLLGGLVRDGVTQIALPGATVTFVRTGLAARPPATTETAGNYLVQLPAGNGYSAEISKPGYITATVTGIEAFANQSRFLDGVSLIPADRTGKGTATGIVTNSVVGTGLGGVTVNLRAGLNVQTGTIFASSQTDATGTYVFDGLETGYYTAEVNRNGFIPTYYNLISVGGLTTKDQNASISPTLADDQYRVVLTWGTIPADLDSHLTGPGSTARFNVYFGSKGPFTFGTTKVQLDVDDVTSFGPETITIDRISQGLYRYSIHDYTNLANLTSNQLSSSGARVRVFNGNRVALDTNVPTGQIGNLWSVFEIENGNLKVLNQIKAVSNVLGAVSISDDIENEDRFFQNLPSK